MISVPMNRPRALIVCSRPEAYEATRVHEAATYLLQMSTETEDDRRLANEAMAWLRGKREEPQASSQPAAVKRKRKGRAYDAAYVIATTTVKDAAMFAAYSAAVPETLHPFGGRFVARDGKLTVLEGDWPHPRLVIAEFPTREAAEAWYRSDAYKKIIPLRLNSASGNLVLVDGPQPRLGLLHRNLNARSHRRVR